MKTQASSSPDDSADIRNVYELKLKNMETILEKEHQAVLSLKTKADLIVDKSYQVVTFEEHIQEV